MDQTKPQPLSKEARKQLKAKAHELKCVIMMGNKGLTTAVIDEIELALEHHELIKIKLPSGDREQKLPLSAEIAVQTNSETIQIVGNVLTLYRKKVEKS